MLSQDKDFTQAMTWIEQQATEMESLLTEWSLINTGTSNLTGLSQQLAAIETQFHSLNATMQRIKLDRIPTLNHQGEPISQQLGDILLVRQRPLATKRFLLCGHMDTVFPSDSPFQRPVTKQPGILVGPGVTDMKGGLVVLLFALRAI